MHCALNEIQSFEFLMCSWYNKIPWIFSDWLIFDQHVKPTIMWVLFDWIFGLSRASWFPCWLVQGLRTCIQFYILNQVRRGWIGRRHVRRVSQIWSGLKVDSQHFFPENYLWVVLVFFLGNYLGIVLVFFPGNYLGGSRRFFPGKLPGGSRRFCSWEITWG